MVDKMVGWLNDVNKSIGLCQPKLKNINQVLLLNAKISFIEAKNALLAECSLEENEIQYPSSSLCVEL